MIRQLRDDAEVVGDQNHRHFALTPDMVDQFQYLRLNRHVERGGRLVGDQQVGISGQRHRDHHTLLHPAGHLMRKGVDPRLRRRNPDVLQQLDHFGTHIGNLRPVQLQHLGDLVADPENRIQRHRGFLKNIGDSAAADLPEPPRGKPEKVDPFPFPRLKFDTVGGGEGRRRRQQPGQRKTADALAAPGFADQRQDFPAGNLKGDPVHHRQHAPPGAEPDRKILHIQ
mgnify:CR=1 FL=1